MDFQWKNTISSNSNIISYGNEFDSKTGKGGMATREKSSLET